MKKLTALLLSLIFVLAGCGNTPDYIEANEAIEIAQKNINEKEKNTITNFDNPTTEELVFDENVSIYLFDSDEKIVGKTAYRITFNTEHDGLLGPIVYYIDKESGKLLGADFRE